MTDLIGKLLEPIKEVIPFILRHFLAISSFIALFGWSLNLLPQGVFEFLNIENLRTTNREAIGVLTFIATFSFCFGALYKGYLVIANKWQNSRNSRRREESLHKLTPTEYKYLRAYIDSQSQTATFTVFDGVVAGLIEKGVLYKTNSQTNKAGEQDFNIHPWAYNYLSTHREILAVKNGEV